MKAIRNILLLTASIMIISSVHIAVKAQSGAQNAKENTKFYSDYALAYPGILPDNPLYNFKLIRDKMFEILIIDSAKKAEYYLLQADKRLTAGTTLFNQKKLSLSTTTISKAEKYFRLSVIELQTALNKGKNISEVLDRTERAINKHHEVISGLLTKNNDSLAKESLDSSLQLVTDLTAQIAQIRIQFEQKNQSTPAVITP